MTVLREYLTSNIGILSSLIAAVFIIYIIYDLFSYKNTMIDGKAANAEAVKKFKHSSIYIRYRLCETAMYVIIWLALFYVYSFIDSSFIKTAFYIICGIAVFMRCNFIILFLFWRCPHCRKVLEWHLSGGHAMGGANIEVAFTEKCPHCNKMILENTDKPD